MKNNIIIKFTFFAIVVLFPISGCAESINGLGNSIIKIRVVDDEGQPITNAHAKIINIYDYDAPSGYTDSDGVYSRFTENIYHLSAYISKNGYYKTQGVFWKRETCGDCAYKVCTHNLTPSADHVFTIVLKRIIDPVEMRRREVAVYVPNLDEPVGFDFEIGDLVFPDGSGKFADIMLMTSMDYVTSNDFTQFIKMEFTGEQNGIQSFSYYTKEGPTRPVKSELPPPPIAPESGYANILERFSKCAPPSAQALAYKPSAWIAGKYVPPNTWTGSIVENRKWIFRTRTVLDDDGNISAANYGWTTSEIFVTTKPDSDYKTIGINFIYYYNPDSNSRSLEPKVLPSGRIGRDVYW